ncbi:hypothetical protein Avbf_13036 [Armadillidium vulgare]|nr:hypothetical protein Avbf_13036 [Armadillidium vulgare]
MKLTYLLMVFLVCLSILSEVSGMPARSFTKRRKRYGKRCCRMHLSWFGGTAKSPGGRKRLFEDIFIDNSISSGETSL